MKVVSGRGPYFAQVPFALIDDASADSDTIAIYAALRRFSDFGSDRGCFASQPRLAQAAGCSRRTVLRRLEWLRDHGWIEWEKSPKGRSNRYIVNNSTSASVAQVPESHTSSATESQQIGQPGTLPRDSYPETTTEISKPAAWVRTLSEDWSKTYGGIPNCGEIGKRLKPLVEEHGFEPLREHWQNYLEATEGRFASPSRFAQTYGSWDRAGGAPAQEGRISLEEARVAFRAAGIPDTWALNPDGYWSRDELERAVAVRVAKLRNNEGAPNEPWLGKQAFAAVVERVIANPHLTDGILP